MIQSRLELDDRIPLFWLPLKSATDRRNPGAEYAPSFPFAPVGNPMQVWDTAKSSNTAGFRRMAGRRQVAALQTQAGRLRYPRAFERAVKQQAGDPPRFDRSRRQVFALRPGGGSI